MNCGLVLKQGDEAPSTLWRSSSGNLHNAICCSFEPKLRWIRRRHDVDVQVCLGCHLVSLIESITPLVKHDYGGRRTIFDSCEPNIEVRCCKVGSYHSQKKTGYDTQTNHPPDFRARH